MGQKETAQRIWNYLTGRRWSSQAVAAVLGNMQSESGIIADRWESDLVGNMSGGYGLVQWTPATKYINWAKSNGLVYQDVISQCKRLEWEVENNQQFYHPSMTFRQFTQSKQPPEYLADIFIRYYERPYNPNQPARQSQARYWFNLLVNSNTSNDTDNNANSNKNKELEDMIFRYVKKANGKNGEIWAVHGSKRFHLQNMTQVNYFDELVANEIGRKPKVYTFDESDTRLKMIEGITKI
ncbi:phage tail tip lysozyme [Mixta tenebrionis]|uniref:phage tail tip lysozyme n=1 Tax=Mixta tenebrionis TaxID=2562439 RepID=UPI001C703CAE|nr:phage tail tip lysozyme [Mixta tenebrionis]